MRDSTPTALIVAAPTLWRQGLINLFQDSWPCLTLALTADATEALDLLAERSFDLVTLDGRLAGRALPNLLLRVYHIRPSQRLLLLAGERRYCTATLTAALPSHFLCLPRQVPPSKLAAALSPWLHKLVSFSSTYHLSGCLSPREIEILRLVAADCCNKDIAEQLYLSVRTVESHRRTLLQKAGTRTLLGLVARAVREGVIP